MSIYTDKSTGRLYIEFQYKHHRHKERLPIGTTKKDAEKLEVKIKNDLMFQSHGAASETTSITFESFIKDYYGHYAQGFAADRFERTTLLIKSAMPFFKGKAMRSIKAADLERFKESRINLLTIHSTKRKPATVEREMSIISSIFTVAVKNDVIDYNPCSRVRKLSFDNVQDKILRREHEAAFFDNMHSLWARDICKMALYTGLRQNDIMTLTPFQVRLDANCIKLIQGKTKRQVTIMLNAVSREIIERRMRSRKGLLFPSPVTGTANGSVRHAMMRACIRAKIPVITIRDLRRTNATRKIENGGDLASVAQSMGHTGVRMMPRYVRSLDAQQKMADSLVEPQRLRKVK